MKAFIAIVRKKGWRTDRRNARPELRDDDVLVQVHAAGVNLLDSKIRNGEFKLLCLIAYRSFWVMMWLGSGPSGISSTAIQAWRPGLCTASTGSNRSFAELISMNEDAAAIMPKKLTMEEAASIPLVALRLAGADRESQPEERAKSSHPRGLWGVGTFAIQLGEGSWCNCNTTTSTANLDLVKRLGADIVIDYRRRFLKLLA